MKFETVTHKACGTDVTYKLGTDTREGTPFCPTCNKDVPRVELSHPNTTLCVVSPA